MTRAVDIVAEYKAAIAAVTPAYRQRLGELGLVAPANRMGLVGVAAAAIGKRGLFEPDAAGAPAIIIPVWDGPIGDATVILAEPERLADLVAWWPKESATLFSRLGIATMLGGEALRAAMIGGAPVRLFRDPGGWARAGGGDAGIVVVDWGEPLLLAPKAIIADDLDHGAEIKAQLKRLRARLVGQIPAIRVPIRKDAAA